MTSKIVLPKHKAGTTFYGFESVEIKKNGQPFDLRTGSVSFIFKKFNNKFLNPVFTVQCYAHTDANNIVQVEPTVIEVPPRTYYGQLIHVHRDTKEITVLIPNVEIEIYV